MVPMYPALAAPPGALAAVGYGPSPASGLLEPLRNYATGILAAPPPPVAAATVPRVAQDGNLSPPTSNATPLVGPMRTR